MKSQILPIIGLGMALAGCQTATPAATTATMSDEQAFKLARARLVDNLKDPDSAKIDPNFVRRAAGFPKTDVVCGRVNGKNIYGAYTGSKAFVYKIEADQILIDGEDRDPAYGSVATMWCRYS